MNDRMHKQRRFAGWTWLASFGLHGALLLIVGYFLPEHSRLQPVARLKSPRVIEILPWQPQPPKPLEDSQSQSSSMSLPLAEEAVATPKNQAHELVVSPSAKSRSAGKSEQPASEPHEVDATRQEPTANEVSTAGMSRLLSLRSARAQAKHVDVPKTPPEVQVETQDSAPSLRAQPDEVMAARAGPRKAPAVDDGSDAGLPGGDEARLRQLLRGYEVTTLPNGKLEVRPPGGEFVATIRKDGAIELEHAAAASTTVCVLGAVCVAVGEIRDAGRKKRKVLNRVRVKAGGGFKGLASRVKSRNEAIIGKGAGKRNVMVPMLLPIIDGTFGYRSKRAVTNAELLLLRKTEPIRRQIMKKELMRSYAVARGRLPRELQEMWQNESYTEEERIETIWLWYVELDVETHPVDDPEIAAAMKDLFELRDKEAHTAKRVIAQFIVDHPAGDSAGFAPRDVAQAQAYLRQTKSEQP